MKRRTGTLAIVEDQAYRHDDGGEGAPAPSPPPRTADHDAACKAKVRELRKMLAEAKRTVVPFDPR